MNKMTKKLLLSVLTVVLTVGALGTTTFAWFTLTSTANVQPFTADVVAETGIEISLDDTTNEGVWVTQLTSAMIQTYIEENIAEPFTFNQVTSPDGYNFELLGGSAALDGFLEIGIQIRSNDATLINLTDIGLSSTGVNWTADVDFTDQNGTPRTGGGATAYNANFFAANSARVSVYDNYASAIQGVYELPAGDGSSVAENTVLGGLTNGTAPADGQRSYYFAKTTNEPVGYNDVTVPATTPSDVVDDLAATMIDNTDLSFEDFGQTYSGYITIRVWLEGWDADMFNAIFADILTLSFQLEDPNAA